MNENQAMTISIAAVMTVIKQAQGVINTLSQHPTVKAYYRLSRQDKKDMLRMAFPGDAEYAIVSGLNHLNAIHARLVRVEKMIQLINVKVPTIPVCLAEEIAGYSVNVYPIKYMRANTELYGHASLNALLHPTLMHKLQRAINDHVHGNDTKSIRMTMDE